MESRAVTFGGMERRLSIASVMGLLNARERAARVLVEELREKVERVLAELAKAEVVLEQRVIARVELAEALVVQEPRLNSRPDPANTCAADRIGAVPRSRRSGLCPACILLLRVIRRAGRRRAWLDLHTARLRRQLRHHGLRQRRVGGSRLHHAPVVVGKQFDDDLRRQGRVPGSYRPRPHGIRRTGGMHGCGRLSEWCHSRYARRLTGATLAGRPLYIDLSARRLYCENTTCPKTTSAEQLPGLTARYQRRTPRLQSLVEDLGVVLVSRDGSRMLRILNIRLSRVAVLSQLMRVPLTKPVTPQALGLDHFALYTADYGSLLVDATTRLTLPLWEGREAEQLGRWLREYPGVEVVCRDGSLTYRQGITGGAPEAVQVSDRLSRLGHRHIEERSLPGSAAISTYGSR